MMTVMMMMMTMRILIRIATMGSIFLVTVQILSKFLEISFKKLNKKKQK